STPSTSTPSTSTPSTSTPSTSTPSTSNPSTSNPSTSIPSTSTPSTSNPSTSNPSTSNPSTSTPSSCPSSCPSVEAYLSKAIAAVNNIQRQISFTRDYQDMGVKSAEWQKVETVVNRAAEAFFHENLSLEVSTEELQVYADPLLEKVFYNLMENSKRHGKKVKTIRVSCRQAGTVCILSYEDDGVGISADLKEKIFEKEFGRNTGYGLFLIKEILDITGISIKERGVEGYGVRFDLEIPNKNYRLSTGTVLPYYKPA
ncbi:MAG: HAMP domain-containing sensor histidine kinase, partial [Methanosarcinaceae archaeon]|nr:HAMP domain-containing sensor histidine kinase [Methanosarcinaceae archaeon]